MRWILIATVSVAVALSLVVAAQTTPAAKRWFSHIEVLAADGMEGRDTGSPGHKRAADYVASMFEKARLEPAGVNGYVQPVRFRTRRIVESQSRLALVREGKAEPLTLGEDANFNVRSEPAASLEAPLVFAGYGLKIPERQIDDFAGLPIQGA